MSEGMPLATDTEVLAWVVLWAANRTQAKGSSVRLVDPRAAEVAHEVGMELITEAQLVEVEEYLHCHGYVEPVDMGLSRGTYTSSCGRGTEGCIPSSSRASRALPVSSEGLATRAW